MNNYTRNTLVLAGIGVCFSGFISFSRLITGVCPLSEPCPYFLGYPACWYGLALFSILFLTSVALLIRQAEIRTASRIHLVTATLGILFAGYFTIPEVNAFFSGTTYTLGLPTCAYGLIFYIVMFALAFREQRA